MALILIMLIIIIFTISFLIISNKTKKPSKNYPPGNHGWPILGESIDFASNPAKFILDRMIKHSPNLFKTSFLGEKVVIFCGAPGNKFVYSNEANLTNCLPACIAKAFSLEPSSANSKSLSWKIYNQQLHKFLTRESMQDLVNVMHIKLGQHLDKYWVPNQEVKIQPLSKKLGFSLACHFFVSWKIDAAREMAEHFYTLAERIYSLPVDLPGTSYNKALKASKIVQGKLVELIRQRREELLAKGADDIDFSVEGQDLLSRVILASIQDCNYESDVNDEEIAGLTIGIIFAGFHTTTTIMTFVLKFLAEYPHVYDKVLQEQLEIAKSKTKEEPLTLKDLQKMKYTWNVICESMRIIPPGIGGFREVTSDISYDGFTIPKGWKVHWNVYSTHMNPTYFPNPEKFDPSRFEEKLPPNVFVPFGGGSHICCGREYARINVLVYVHNVVTRYKLSKANPNEKIIYRPDPIAVEGLRIRFQPHQK